MSDDELRVRALEAEIERLRSVVTAAIEQVAQDAPRTEILMTLRAGLSQWEQWTKDAILDRARAWHVLYGESPSDTAWSPTALRKKKRVEEIERFLSDRWPSSSAVRRHWGGFPQMLAAAGLPQNPLGHRSEGRGVDDDRLPQWTGWELLSGFRAQRDYSVRLLAERAGLSWTGVHSIETGRARNPGVRTLLALSRGLGVRASALLDE